MTKKRKVSDKIIAFVAVMMLLVGSIGLAYASGENGEGTDIGNGEGIGEGSNNIIQDQDKDLNNEVLEKQEQKADNATVDLLNLKQINANETLNNNILLEEKAGAEIKMLDISVDSASGSVSIATQTGIADGTAMSTSSALSNEAFLDTTVKITFDKKLVTTAGINSQYFEVKQINKSGALGNKVITISEVIYGDKTATLKLESNLESNNYYQINVKAGVQSSAKETSASTVNYAGIFKAGAETGSKPEEPENVSLSAILAYPINGSRNVELNPEIIVEFNKEVKQKTITKDSVELTSGGVAIPATLTLNENKKSLKITPNAQLSYDTTYTLNLNGDITDGGGEALKPLTFTFVTKSARIQGVEAVFNTSGTALETLKVNLENLNTKRTKEYKLLVEIRRGLGASIEAGGTVVYREDVKVSKTVSGVSIIDIGTNIDLTKERLFNDLDKIEGKIFIDVYVTNQGKGVQVGDAYHQELKK